MPNADTLPFPVTEVQLADSAGEVANWLNPLLGREYQHANGNQYRLVRVDRSAALASPQGRVFSQSDPIDLVKSRRNDVDTCDGGASVVERPYVIAPEDLEDLADNAYFLGVITGADILVIHSDESSNTLVAARPYCVMDDDADEGKIAGTATYEENAVVGRLVSGTAATDAEMRIDIDKKLMGGAVVP